MLEHSSKTMPGIPRETVRAANAIFGRSNFYIVTGEHLEDLLDGLQDSGPSAENATLALITYFQFLEGLTDSQAIDAIRTRLDWKFALHLPLVPRTYHETTLYGFRQQVLLEPAHQRGFQSLLDRLVRLTPGHTNFQSLQSLEVVAAVCTLNRLDRVQQAMNRALEALATRFPQWLRRHALSHWYGRYSSIATKASHHTSTRQPRFSMEEIGKDIQDLLEKISNSGTPEMVDLPEVDALYQVWSQQFQTRHVLDSNVYIENQSEGRHPT